MNKSTMMSSYLASVDLWINSVDVSHSKHSRSSIVMDPVSLIFRISSRFTTVRNTQMWSVASALRNLFCSNSWVPLKPMLASKVLETIKSHRMNSLITIHSSVLLSIVMISLKPWLIMHGAWMKVHIETIVLLHGQRILPVILNKNHCRNVVNCICRMLTIEDPIIIIEWIIPKMKRLLSEAQFKHSKQLHLRHLPKASSKAIFTPRMKMNC